MARDTVQRGRTAMVILGFLLSTLLPRPGVAQTRADSIAVIRAAVEAFARGDGPYFVGDGAPDLVLSALRQLPELGITETPSRTRVLCGDALMPDVVGPDEVVGRSLSVSLNPGRVPGAATGASADSLPTGGLTGRFRSRPRAFYLDEQVAYVRVSLGCWRRPGGGGVSIRLGDGRVLSSFSSGVVYELRRGPDGWSVAGPVETSIS